MTTPPDPTDDVEARVIADVGKYGWQVEMIPEDDEGPGFAYSVGIFHTFGHPEFIVFGLVPDEHHNIINLAGELVRNGMRFIDGDTSSGILQGLDVRFRTVAKNHYREYLGFGGWFYKGDDFPTLQIVWPDSAGCFPGDEGFPEPFLRLQPDLSAGFDS